MLNLTHRELNYKTNLKYTIDFSQTDAQIQPYFKIEVIRRTVL